MKLEIADADLKPIIVEMVRAVLAEIGDNHARLDGKLAYAEVEAAAMIGVARHVLRDCRLRHEIVASKVGKRYLYPRESLLRFLQDHSTS